MSANPGWYADPSGTGGERYFDGEEWTENLRAAKQETEKPEEAEARPYVKPEVRPEANTAAERAGAGGGASYGQNPFYETRTSTTGVNLGALEAPGEISTPVMSLLSSAGKKKIKTPKKQSANRNKIIIAVIATLIGAVIVLLGAKALGGQKSVNGGVEEAPQVAQSIIHKPEIAAEN